MGVEITVVDDSDAVGWIASATREGEIYMKNVPDMVAKVISKLNSMKPYTRVCNPAKTVAAPRMDRLNILDHGSPTGFQVGGDRVTMANFATHQPEFQKLALYFAKGGFVHLQHCEIGQNEVLMKKLAKAVNAAVFAGTGDHNPLYRFNFGDYVKVTPDGKVKKDVDRP